MARLAHPNVVGVYDLFAVGDTLFIAMELVEGTTLREWLASRRRSWREVLAELREAGRGLVAAHAEGIVHRDFKPENVLVGRSGRVCVSDFGLSRLKPAAGAPGHEEPSTRSLERAADEAGSTFAHAGTPRYMAPEQRLGERATEKSDQFAFCVALYEALYAAHPFGSSIRTASLEASRPARQTRHTKEVPPWVRRCVLRGLSLDPAARYPSMQALLDDLAHDPSRPRRRLVTAVGVFSLLAAAVGVEAATGCHAPRPRRASRERGARGAWDDRARDQVHAAFAASGAPYAEDVWRSVARTLDAYASGWGEAQRDACEATRVRKDQTEAVLALRTACLDRRRERLVHLGFGVFRGADRDVVTRAPRALDALERVEGLRRLEGPDRARDAAARRRVPARGRRDPRGAPGGRRAPRHGEVVRRAGRPRAARRARAVARVPAARDRGARHAREARDRAGRVRRGGRLRVQDRRVRRRERAGRARGHRLGRASILVVGGRASRTPRTPGPSSPGHRRRGHPRRQRRPAPPAPAQLRRQHRRAGGRLGGRARRLRRGHRGRGAHAGGGRRDDRAVRGRGGHGARADGRGSTRPAGATRARSPSCAAPRATRTRTSRAPTGTWACSTRASAATRSRTSTSGRRSPTSRRCAAPTSPGPSRFTEQLGANLEMWGRHEDALPVPRTRLEEGRGDDAGPLPPGHAPGPGQHGGDADVARPRGRSARRGQGGAH